MVKQYPHNVIISVPRSGEQNSQGDWVPIDPADDTNIETKGRFEPQGNKSSQYITGVDGTQIAFFGIVFMPVLEQHLKHGASVSVTDDNGNVIARGSIKQFYAGQLNFKAWL
jgi:hypothetical protein